MQYFSSLKLPVNLAQYRVIIGTFNASIIMIKIKNRPISRLYYICNTNQLSKQHLIFSSIAIFCFIILFPSKKEIQNLTRLYRSVLFNIMYNSLAVQVKTSLSSDIEANPRPAQKNKTNHFLSVIGILIVFLLMLMPKYHY